MRHSPRLGADLRDKGQESSGNADTVARMSVWDSLAIGGVGLLTLLALVGVLLAAILDSVGRDVSELLELEPWASTPLTHRVLPVEQVGSRGSRV